MVALVTLGSALIGVARGGLGARERYAAVGASLVAENVVRLVGRGGADAAPTCESPVAFGACLVAGQLCAFLWPSALRFGSDGAALPSSRAFAFLAGAGLSQLVAQVVLTVGAGGAGARRRLPRGRDHAVRGDGAVPGAVPPRPGQRGAAHRAPDPAGRRPRRGHPGPGPPRPGRPGGAGGAARLGDGGVAGPRAAPPGLRAGGRPRRHGSPGWWRSAARWPWSTCWSWSTCWPTTAPPTSRPPGSGRPLAGAVAYALLSGLDPTDRTVWAFVVAEAAAHVGLLVLLPRERSGVSAPGLTAARNTDDPNGRSRRRSTRPSTPERRGQHPVRPRGDRGEALDGRPADGPAEPAYEPLRGEHREHRGEGVRRPLHPQPGPLHRGHQPGPGVATVVPGPDVVVGPGPLVRRHGEQQPAAGRQHPDQLGERQRLVRAVLDDVEGGDHLEGTVAERQRGRGAADALTRGQPAAGRGPA